MKKVTFNTLPKAISELLDRVERIEQILSNKPRASQSKTVRTKKSKSQGPPPDKLTVKEAGKYLNLSLVTLYSYIKNKKIPFEKQGRRLFFSKVDLEKWNQNRSYNGPSVPEGSITIKEAEKLLNVPSSTLYYFIKSRKIQAVSKKGNQLLYSKKELTKALNKKNKKNKAIPKEPTEIAPA